MGPYPVTAMFKPIPGVGNMSREKVIETFVNGHEQECQAYIDYKNNIIVLLPNGAIDPITYQYNYLEYINTRLCNGETTANGLFDAGYVPFIYMPVLIPSKATPRDFIQKLKQYASVRKARLYRTSCALLPSDFKSDKNIYDSWISRADLHRLWDDIKGIDTNKEYSNEDSFDVMKALYDIYVEVCK